MADPIIGKISVGDGATFTPSVTGDVLSWTNNKNLPNPASLDIVGATFTPSVSNAGVLSWSNNKGLPNPASVDMAQAVVDKKPGWGIPIGYEYFTFNPNVPQGALPLFGGEYSRTTYSDLWAWVQQQTGYLKTEAEWQTLSTSNNGNVPYYSDGDGSTTFRVPSLKCWIKGANGTVSEVGSYLEAGLPNITGSFRVRAAGSANVITAASAPFTSSSATTTSYSSLGTGSASTSIQDISFNASSDNAIYGNSTTVQPESVVGLWLVQAYGVVVDTGTINEQQYIDDRIAAEVTRADGTYLPLTGGTIMGPLTTTGKDGRIFGLISDTNTEYPNYENIDIGWNWENGDGAGVGFRSASNSDSGYFNIYARSGNTAKTLEGRPNGTLTWGGSNVVVSGTLQNGHGMLAGNKGGISVSANSYVMGTVNFGQTFASAPTVVVCQASGHAHIHAATVVVRTTNFDYIVSSEGPSQTTSINWIAIG